MSLILDRICYVSHLTKNVNNSKKESYVIDQALAGIAINIQPGAAEDTILSDGNFAQTWIAFTTESGIRSGDKITVSGYEHSRVFMVKGIEDWDMLDIPHYELTLAEFEENEYI